MPITINREQRAALYEQIADDLSGIDAVYQAIEQHDYTATRRFRCEFVAQMRLLDDLGWAKHDASEHPASSTS